MPRQAEQNDKYFSTFSTKLRELLESHPEDGHSTTYKALGEAVGVRQQTISQYACGQTQPTADVVLRIAQFFGVSVDYMLTGTSSCNRDISETLGLTESSIRLLEIAKKTDNFDGMPTVTDWINSLLSDRDFYDFLEDLIFRVDNYKKLDGMPPEKREKMGNLDIEGYYLWEMQMAVEEFIRKQLNRHGLGIDRN